MNIKTSTPAPGDLIVFVSEVFTSLVRTDERATSSYYLRGLMLEGRKEIHAAYGQAFGY